MSLKFVSTILATLALIPQAHATSFLAISKPIPGVAPLTILAKAVSESDCRYFGLGDSSVTAILNGAAFQSSDEVSDVQQHVSCVAWALKNGADPNQKTGDFNPLILAVSYNHEDLVKLLIQSKADVNAKDDKGLSAVFWAATNQEDEILQDLLSAGANPKTGEPLYMAASKADSVAVKALLATHKIPVSQLTKFPSYDGTDASETALDASESRLSMLNQYFEALKNSVPDPLLDSAKAESLLSLFSYQREMNSQFQRAPRTIKMVQKDQAQVSALLKAAGWKCNLPQCGISDGGNAFPDSNLGPDSTLNKAD